MEVKSRAWSDSAAALAVARRMGVGKIKHLDIATLWLQEKVHGVRRKQGR